MQLLTSCEEKSTRARKTYSYRIAKNYKFLRKYDNETQLEEQVRNEASKEYLKRIPVIWTNDISIPRKVYATKTFALPALQYHMWTSDWPVNQLKEIDRRTREIIRRWNAPSRVNKATLPTRRDRWQQAEKS